MFSPKEENVRKKFSQKMFKNMKHFPNMFKKSVVLSIQTYCQVSAGRDVQKGPGRGYPTTNFLFLCTQPSPNLPLLEKTRAERPALRIFFDFLEFSKILTIFL